VGISNNKSETMKPPCTKQQNTTTLTPAMRNQTSSSHPSHDSDATSDDDVDSTTNDPQQPPHPPTKDTIEDLEPWVDSIKCCTLEAEDKMQELKLEDGVTMQESCPKVLSSDSFEWTNTACCWDPTLDPRLNSHRRIGRPKARRMAGHCHCHYPAK